MVQEAEVYDQLRDLMQEYHDANGPSRLAPAGNVARYFPVIEVQD